MTDPGANDDEFDVVAAFGGVARGERVAVYIPNKDRNGDPVDQKPWIDEVVRLLAAMGGATVMPPVTGAWLNPETKRLVIEEPVIVYSYVDPDAFVGQHRALAEFARRLGRETNQGAVAMEYGGTFFTVEDFD